MLALRSPGISEITLSTRDTFWVPATWDSQPYGAHYLASVLYVEGRKSLRSQLATAHLMDVHTIATSTRSVAYAILSPRRY